jgi:DNA-binding response OmpR family regulator
MDKKTILIIDDSYSSLLLMDYALKKEGYNTQVALNVQEAIEVIKKNIPDLIILDLNLPEISGYDFLRMKVEVKIEGIPIIVVSALDSHDSVQLSKNLGASDFISKPINLDLVNEKIKALIR